MSVLSTVDGLLTWNVISKTLAVILIHYAGFFLYRRWKLNKQLPGYKFGIFNISGDLKYFRGKPSEKYVGSPNAYYLSILGDYARKFRKDTFFHAWAYLTPFIVIVKAQGVEDLISGNKHLRKSWIYNWMHTFLHEGLLTSYGQKWRTRRKIISPAFHQDILNDFLPAMNEQTETLIGVLRKETTKEHSDLIVPLTLWALDVICETNIGVRMDAQKNWHSEYVQALIRTGHVFLRRLESAWYVLDPIFKMSKLGQQYRKDMKTLSDFTSEVIREKKAQFLSGNKTLGKRKALLDSLMEMHLRDGTLSEQAILEEVETFTFAGHDATALATTWALYMIGLHQDVQARVHEELYRIFGDSTRHATVDDLKDMEYLERVLKETQRLYPSVPLIGRRSEPGTVINGHKIPAGISCMILSFELHRDPEVFPDPEKFDPDRFLPENTAGRHPFAYIPFSAGARSCLGQRFALMEVKVVLSHILRNFTLESLDPREALLPTPEIILRNSKPLKIRLRERVAA